MLNILKVIYETGNGFQFTIVELISIISLFFGISVITCKNPIVSVLFLIGLFISISVNLIFVGFTFLGLSYLLVYVGAISILFLFILMLINIRISELLDDTNNGIPLAIYTGFSFCFPIYLTFISTDNLINISTDTKDLKKTSLNTEIKNYENYNVYNSSETPFKEWPDKYSTRFYENFNALDRLDQPKLNNLESIGFNSSKPKIHYVSSNSWDTNLTDGLDITSIGNVLYSTFGIWLIICSIILLLAMIGAITITKKEKD